MKEVKEERRQRELDAIFTDDDAVTLSDVDPYSFAILAVCTGNICRSPLAEAALAGQITKMANDLGLREDFFVVSSSGVMALEAAPVDDEVRQVSAKYGEMLVDHLALHRSVQFDPRMAERTHLILTATREHRDAVIAEAPAAAPRTFTLREFAALVSDRPGMTSDVSRVPAHRPSRISRRLQRMVAHAHAARQLRKSTAGDDIEDPYRQSRETHERVADRIVEATTVISERIRGELM